MTLFNITIDRVMKKCNLGLTIRRKMVQVVPYWDDLALVARNNESLKEALSNIESKARRRGLEINQDKTK